MNKKEKNRSSEKETAKDGINYDFDYNSEYGDGDIPDIDKPSKNSTSKKQ